MELFGGSAREAKDHEMKLRCFRGKHDGPNLLITAGVHGDEFVPMLTLWELIRQFETGTLSIDSICGSVTLVPTVNESAFERGHRCGDDNLDLARTCPGNTRGTITERVAAELSALIRDADFYIDLHTGGTESSVFPLAGYSLHPDGEILEKQRGMARAFNLPFIWGTSANLEGRSLSVARDANVPAIYTEYLGGLDKSDESRDRCVQGCLNVMSHLNMLDRPLPASRVAEIIEDIRPESGHMQICNPSPISGFFETAVELGQDIMAGDRIGDVFSVTGDEACEVLSSQTGKIIVLRIHPRVNMGEMTAVIAESTS